MSIGLIVILVIIIGGIAYIIGIYNGLVRGRNEFKNAFAQIDVQLQRRYDLIPNLVETAKGYLKPVIQARNQAHAASRQASAHPEDGSAIGALGAAEGVLTGALGKFFALAEAYPNLKANETMQQLMEELSSTENKISFARQHFNDSVMDYNNRREQFPNSMVAGPFNFQPAHLLQLEDKEARKAVKVQF